ncbi:MAG: hypothetical protein ACKN9W_17255 [Methylococcus sp.]
MKCAGGSIPAVGNFRYSPDFTGLETQAPVNPGGRLKELIMTRRQRQSMLFLCLSAISSFAAARTEPSMRRAEAAPGLFTFTPVLLKSPGFTPVDGSPVGSRAGTHSVPLAAAHDGRVLQSCQTSAGNCYAPCDIQCAAGSKNLVGVTNRDIGIYRRGDCGVIENPFFASTVPW